MSASGAPHGQPMSTPDRSPKSLVSALVGLLAVALAGLIMPAAAQAPQPAPAAPAAEAKKPPQTAQLSTLPAEVAAALSGSAAELAEVEARLQNLSETEERLGELRTRVEEVLDKTTQTAEALRPQLAAVRSQIEKLGPAPSKDGPAEAPEMAAERGTLTALAAALDGAIKTSELNWVRARQLIERITALRHALFTKNLMERLPSPLLPGVWREIAFHATNVGYQFKAWADHWWLEARQKRTALTLLAAAALLLYVVLQLIISRWTDRRALKAEPPLPTFFERAVSAFRTAPLRALPIFAAGFLLFVGLDALRLLDGNPWGRSVPAILTAVLIFAAVRALLSAVLAPKEPQWRLAPLADRSARRVARLLGTITAIYAIDGALTEIGRAFSVPLMLSVAQSLAVCMAFAAALMGLLLTPFVPQGAEALPVSRHRPRWLKLPLWAVAIGIVAAALSGYVALARFAAQQLVLTGIVALVGWLGFLAIRAFTREPPQRGVPVGELLEQRFGLDAPRRHQLARLTEFTLTFALVVGLLPLLMLQWGFSGADIRDWLKVLLFGVEIGQFRISLARILAGIVLFIALVFATRLFQRWLRERMQPRMDAGIAHSIETVVGYACVALAALVAVSYAGFDITSLAIVAGALSLGIGFGLQSIVNNFVSGLILLIERPIKVGDRLIVGDQQGHVRRISVRATEIETFDRASLLIPNSDLITGRVLNWTHRDQLAAFNVKVGVSYRSDPEQVIAILVKCAEEHPKVLRTPPPTAVLEAFGDSALLFNLRVALPDVGIHIGVQSDLRVAIFKALGAAGIEIPFNQLDVNVRDLQAIKAYLAEILREPPTGADGEVGALAPAPGARAGKDN
jgi:small-conductance mechanosensitive channel